jgi:hypothetical protein
MLRVMWNLDFMFLKVPLKINIKSQVWKFDWSVTDAVCAWQLTVFIYNVLRSLSDEVPWLYFRHFYCG